MCSRRLEVHSLFVDFRVAVVAGDPPVDQRRRSSDASFVRPLRLLLWAALTSSGRSTEGGKAGQWSPVEMGSSLLLRCSWTLTVSGGRGSVHRGGAFLPDLGLQFCHQLVKGFASAHHFSSLVDGVDIACQEASADLLPVGVEDAAVLVQVTLPLGSHFVVGSGDSVGRHHAGQGGLLPGARLQRRRGSGRRGAPMRPGGISERWRWRAHGRVQ